MENFLKVVLEDDEMEEGAMVRCNECESEVRGLIEEVRC